MKNLIYAFNIDWRLIIAQAINFLVVFFVLYKFVFKPLQTLVNQRQKKIIEGLQREEKSKKIIEEAKRIKEEILKQANKEKMQIVEEIKQIKQEKIHELNEEINNLRQEMLASMDKEKERIKKEFYQNLYQEFPNLFIKLSQKIFHKPDLNREFIKKAIQNDE